MTSVWIERWKDVIAADAEQPGVWRRRDGGFHIRGRTRDPKTGKRREVNRILPDCKRAREAAVILETELANVAAAIAAPAATTRPCFAKWGVEVFDRKIASSAIVSVSGRDKWDSILRLHLVPAFGPIFVDKLTRDDIERWKAELLAPRKQTKGTEKTSRAIEAGRYSPATINTVLGVLRQITAEASREFNMRDVAADVDNVSARGHRTYTYEEPNSIKPGDVPRFLAEFRARFPEHYAFVFLGFTTGLRPSSLRPLRCMGDSSDVKWDDGRLLVRRSHTRGAEVMDSTKTGVDQVLDLDPEQLAVLRWHVDRLAADNERRARRAPEHAAAMAASELLFPASPTRWSSGGGFQSRSALTGPFEVVGEALKLGYEVSPRSMRRTFQDLARAAKIGDITTRAISGHATETMQRHYSTVAGAEVREGMAKVIDIATGRERSAA